MNSEKLYDDSLLKLTDLSNEIQTKLNFEIDYENIDNVESTLNTQDYCFAFLFGFLGAFVSTNEALEQYLKDIHNSASEQPGDYDDFQILMGSLLHHKKDSMDTMKNRNFDDTIISFHRLLFGHDVLSINKDNPFYLMIQQKGSVLGRNFTSFKTYYCRYNV